MAKKLPDTIAAFVQACRDGGDSATKVPDAPGLWFRMTSQGVMSWSLVYRARGSNVVRRYSLGRYPDVPLREAREEAQEWRTRIAKGEDPHEEARRLRQEEADERAEVKRQAAEAAAATAALKARLTVREACEQFYIAKAGARSVRNMRNMLENQLVRRFGDKALVDLTRADVTRMQNEIAAAGNKRNADNVTSTTRSLLSWAVDQRHVTENIAARFKKKQGKGEGTRERKLSAAEIKALWLLLDRDDVGLSPTMRRIIRLAILLGQRANELGGMRRSELSPDLMTWTIPAARMKAKQPHRLPLPPHARAIIAEAIDGLTGPVVFPSKIGAPFRTTSLSHSMAKLQRHLGFCDADGAPNPAKLHDLRRTMVTGMQKLGVQEQVYKRVIAHTEKDVTAAHYAQSDMERDMAEALAKWQKAVAQMVRGEDPFASKVDDTVEMERRILGADLIVSASAPQAENVVPMKRAG